MARYAILDGDIVANITVCEDSAFASEQGWVVAPPEVAPGWIWDAPGFSPPPPPGPEELAALEQRLHRKIDIECGQFRMQFITDVPGQAQTYEMKRLEAEAYAADPNGDYPFIEAEAAATGKSVAEVAYLVTATAAQWRQLGSAIEGMRMGAKHAVTVGKNVEDEERMLQAAQVNWQALLP